MPSSPSPQEKVERTTTEFLGTRLDPTTGEAGNLAAQDIDRCAACGYWMYVEQLDDEGFCEECVAVEREIADEDPRS